MQSKIIHLTGKVPGLKKDDAAQLAVYLLQGDRVLAKTPLASDGSFRLALVRAIVTKDSAYALSTAIAPASIGDDPSHLADLPRVSIPREQLEKADRELKIATEGLRVSDATLKIWSTWCHQHCVSGTLVGPTGCPVPGAAVTVYSVAHTGLGYSKVPRATVTTDANGNFTACFGWCSCLRCRPCWPCHPIWWNCWPWWWELDILHVIEQLERQPIPRPGPGPVEQPLAGFSLIRPEGRALIRGQGFTAAHAIAQAKALSPDAARTALIKNKLSNARIRALFPWWWWCCDEPNIVFSAAQGGHTILDENPAIDTRWCLADGNTVLLVADASAITSCGPGSPPSSGFAWTRVGSITVDHIVDGYANWWGGDADDAAFAGTLDIYGAFAPGTPVSYYQVDAGQWLGNPARGGSAPGSGSAIAVDLYNYVFVYDSGGNLVTSTWVQMGPFDHNGTVNLYATEEARETGPTPPGLSPFPTIPAGGFALWAYRDRKVYASASALIGGKLLGAVDLTLVGYDASFSPVTLTPDAPVTLMVDTTGLTTADVTAIAAFRFDGTAAPLTNSGVCASYDLGPGGYVQVTVTTSDTAGHLYAYRVDAEHGHNITETITPPGVRAYVSNPLGSPNYSQKSWTGGTEVMTYYPPVECCYEMRLRAGKRVTDGYSAPSVADYGFQTIGLKV